MTQQTWNRIAYLFFFVTIGCTVFFRSLGQLPGLPRPPPPQDDWLTAVLLFGQAYIGPWLETLLCLALLTFVVRQRRYSLPKRLIVPTLSIIALDLIYKTSLSFFEAQRFEKHGTGYKFVGLPFDLRQYPLRSLEERSKN
jgi:hypothetical protein